MQLPTSCHNSSGSCSDCDSSGEKGGSSSSGSSLHSLPLRWSVNDAYNDEPAILSLINGHNYDLTPSPTSTTPTTSSSSSEAAEATELSFKKKFDLIIACDILFFKDYHTDLIATLRRLIDPVGGKVLLLQPRRGILHLLQILYIVSVILKGSSF